MLDTKNINRDRLPSIAPMDEHLVNDGIVFDYEGGPIGKTDVASESGLPIVRWSEFAKVEFPASKWLVKNLVPAGGFLILAAPSGEKKSWIALALADSIARGTPFLGHFPVEKGAVLYLNGEMAKSEVQRRGKIMGLTNEDDLWLLNQELDFYNDESNVDWLYSVIAEKKIRAVFIDTFRAFAGGMKEEKAEENQRIFKQHQALPNAFRCDQGNKRFKYFRFFKIGRKIIELSENPVDK